MRKALVLAIVVIWISCSCAGYQKLVDKINTPPAGCEDSLVYKLIPQPSITMILSSIPYEHLINNEGYLKWARDINTLAIKLLDDQNMTYGRFGIALVAEASTANQWWGSTLVSVADILSQFIVTGGDKVITACDRAWLQTWARNALFAHGSTAHSFFDKSTNEDNEPESKNRICGWTAKRPATV